MSFRLKGEIFLRSLAFARDDGLRPVTFAPLRSFDVAQDMLCQSHSSFLRFDYIRQHHRVALEFFSEEAAQHFAHFFL